MLFPAECIARLIRQAFIIKIEPEPSFEEVLHTAQALLLYRLASKNPLFKMACDLVERFTALIRKTPREDARASLGLWATDAASSSVPSLASFASGLRDDWQAS